MNESLDNRAPAAILMYHRVANDAPAGFEALSVPPSLFDEQLAALVESGCRFATVGALWRGSVTSGPGPLVVVTFDDGLADLLSGALPALAARALPATAFVPTAYVGGRASWMEGEAGRMPMLDWGDLAAIADCGVELGGHGHLHAAADRMDSDAVRSDALRCRRLLEEHGRRPVTSFAYPYGHQRRGARMALRAAGYRAACTTVDSLANAADDLLALPRLAIGPTVAPEALVARVHGAEPFWMRRWVRAKQDVWLLGRRLRGSRARGASVVLGEAAA